MLAHVALPSCQTEGGYWAGERGLLSTAQVQCGKNGGLDGVSSAWLYLFLYIVIVLYCYMLIYLYRYCVVYLLLYCMLEAWRYCFLYIYILFLFLTSTSIFLLLWLPSLNHLAFYGAKVWRFCQIPNTRRCLIRLKLFRNAFHKCCTFGFSKKLSTELFGVLTLRNHPLLMHVKRLYDDEMTE